MADVSFFPSFNYKWAQTGQSITMDDTQYKLGWAYIGTTHPSVEQFNKVFQVADEKSNFLYRQIQNAVTSRGLTMAASNDNSLRDAINTLLPVGVPLPWPNGTPPEGFLLMSGQSISSAQYPVLVSLYGSRLPDMRERFVRGASSAIAPLTTQEDSIKSHAHTATTASNGSHNHTGTAQTAGTHNHAASTGQSGEHRHVVNLNQLNSNSYEGWGRIATGGDGPEGTIPNIVTEPSGNHTHQVYVNNAGSHTHSVAVNSAGAHSHSVTVNATGSAETRPKSIAFYYICRAG